MNSDNAVARIFGRGGRITLDAGITANRVISNSALFELTGQPLVLVGNNPTISGPLTINNELVASTGSLQFTGTGEIIVKSAIRSPQITNRSRKLTLGSGVLMPDTKLTNQSTFEEIALLGDQTFSQFSGAANFSGSATLTATDGFRINSGSMDAAIALLGDIEVDGSFAIYEGTTGGGALKVTSGWFRHGGVSTNESLDIASGANFAVWHFGHDLDPALRGLSPDAVVSNSGTLQMDYDDTVGSYHQNRGILSGSGTLTVTDKASVSGSISGSLSGKVEAFEPLTLDGTISGESFTLKSDAIVGSFGSITSDHVLVGEGATLDVRSYNQAFSRSATIENQGNIRLERAHWVSRYVQEGTAVFDGAPDAGALVVTEGIILRGGTVNAALMGNLEIDGGHTHLKSFFGGGAFVMRGGTLETGYNGMAHTQVTSFVQLDGVIQGYKSFVVTGDTELQGGSFGANIFGGYIRTSGDVEVSGQLMGDDVVYTFVGPVMGAVSGTLHVAGGTLTMSAGGINHKLVRIDNNASLVNHSDFHPDTTILNHGTIRVEADNSIRGFTNNGGFVSGGGRLTVLGTMVSNGGELAGIIDAQSGASLREGTVVSGELFGEIRTDGDVTISGKTAGKLQIDGGTLTLTGSVDSFVHVRDGTSLIGNGRIKRDVLNEGSLLTLAEGDRTLKIDGNLANHGLISMSVTDAANHDQIKVGGIASLGGNLIVTNNGDGLDAGEVARLIDADRFTGEFEGFQAVGFDNAVLFDDSTGRLVGMGGGQSGSASRYMNLNESQTDLYFSLYEDSVEIGGRNVTFNGNTGPKRKTRDAQASGTGGSVVFTSGLSDGDALLVDALNAATFTDPGKIQAAVINRLSPEVHRGMADYTGQALRAQVRAGVETTPVSRVGRTQIFAVAHSAADGVDSDVTGAGYDLQINGFTTGARYDLNSRVQLGGFFGGDDGSIEGNLIDTDARGLHLGAFGRYLAHQETNTTLTASLAFGGCDFDVERRSFGGAVTADNVGSDVFEVMLGARTTAYQKGGLRILPNAALRYLSGHVESFSEAGTGVPLNVGGQDIDSLMIELGVDVEYKVLEPLTITGNLGYFSDFKSSGESLDASFAASGPQGRPFAVGAPGIDQDGITLGVGAFYDFNETMRASIGYRGDFRLAAEDAHSFNLGISFGF